MGVQQLAEILRGRQKEKWWRDEGGTSDRIEINNLLEIIAPGAGTQSPFGIVVPKSPPILQRVFDFIIGGVCRVGSRIVGWGRQWEQPI